MKSIYSYVTPRRKKEETNYFIETSKKVSQNKIFQNYKIHPFVHSYEQIQKKLQKARRIFQSCKNRPKSAEPSFQ